MDELSPAPWRLRQGAGTQWVADADGDPVCDAVAAADGRLIIAAREAVGLLRRLTHDCLVTTYLARGETACPFCLTDIAGGGQPHADCAYIAARAFLAGLTSPESTRDSASVPGA